METRRLGAFIQIVDSGSLTRAASIIGIAQPALSQQLSDLERQFGAQLLIRHHSGVTPTPAGAKLYKHAQTILRQLEVAATDIANDLSGSARIGTVTSIASNFLAPLLKRLTESFPSLNLVIQENTTSAIVEKLDSRTLDLGVAFVEPSVPGIISTPLVAEPLLLVSSAERPAPFQGPHITNAELAQLPLVLPTTGTLNRKLIDQAFAARGVRPNLVAEVDSLSGLTAAVNANIAVVILPALVAHSTWPGIRLQAIPGLERTMSLCVAESTANLPAIDAISDFLKTFFAEMVKSGAWPSARYVG